MGDGDGVLWIPATSWSHRMIFLPLGIPMKLNLRTKQLMPIAITGSLAALAFASDGTCTPGFPVCPTPLPNHGAACGSNRVWEIDYDGPMTVYACTGKSTACSPTNADCNKLMYYTADRGLIYGCGDSARVFCIVGGLSGGPFSADRNCNWEVCGPNPIPVPNGLVPACSECYKATWPTPTDD